MDTTNNKPNPYAEIPKVELHLHLEGAIPLPAMWQLVEKYGGDPEVKDFQALKKRFAYRDFPHFIDVWIWHCGYLREYEDFKFIAEAAARDLASQNVRYAEAFYSPTDFTRHGLTVQGITTAIREGLNRVPQTRVTLITDLVRDTGPDRAMRTLAQVSEVRDRGVIGVGIGGSEQDFPPEPFAQVYLRARELGFHTTAHAGEAAGSASIWGAINTLHVERIGHGTRAEEDPRLLDYLAASHLPIEMCPLSNVRTGVVPSIDVHPIRRYFQRGLCITVNTDDPWMFGNSLAEEYHLLDERLGFSRAEIRGLILNGVEASWLPADEKAALRSSLISDPHW